MGGWNRSSQEEEYHCPEWAHNWEGDGGGGERNRLIEKNDIVKQEIIPSWRTFPYARKVGIWALRAGATPRNSTLTTSVSAITTAPINAEKNQPTSFNPSDRRRHRITIISPFICLLGKDLLNFQLTNHLPSDTVDSSAMFKLLSKIAVHPWFISIWNLWFSVIAISASYDIFQRGVTPIKASEEIIEGVAMILIAWGVALEERGKLREIFGIAETSDPKESAHQAGLDENFHRYGLGILLCGLFADVGVESVKVPDHIINTHGIEHAVLLSSIFLVFVGGVLMIKQVLHFVLRTKE